MKIGVIGIGEMGGTLARRWCEKGHTLRVANSRGLLAVKRFADSIGAEAADVHGTLEGAEVVVHAMAFPVAATLPNYYPDVRDPRIPEIDQGMPESIWASRQLGHPIFKAFNSIMFYALSELGKPEGASDRLAIPVAGDDPKGKSVVMSLITTWDLIRSTAACCRSHGDSSLPRPRTAATMTPKQPCAGSAQRSKARRKKYATPRGGKSTAGYSRTSRPVPMSMPRSSK
jgi:predicted dinucleotide-binding enzyme